MVSRIFEPHMIQFFAFNPIYILKIPCSLIIILNPFSASNILNSLLVEKDIGVNFLGVESQGFKLSLKPTNERGGAYVDKLKDSGLTRAKLRPPACTALLFDFDH